MYKMIKNVKLKEKWLKEQCDVSPKEYALLERATDTLINNVAYGDDMLWKPYHCIMPGGPGFQGIWNWDTAFHSMAVSRWDTELAKECILGFMKFQKEDGMLPDVIRVDGSVEERVSKPPVMPWAAEIVYKRCKDKEFIKKIYPMFKQNEHWWREKRYADGMFYYSAEADKSSEDFEILAGWESGWDNSPRWDFASVADVWAIDLNCYMVMFYRSMKFFARELGINKEAVLWDEKEKELVGLINERLWDDDKQYYADANRFTGEVSNVLTPASFMPLYVEIATQERAENMNIIVKDKNKFDNKMPTVSYDNSGFSENYWRGPTWLNVAYFAAKGLKKYGFDSAEKIKMTILEWCEKEKRGIYENYDSISGKGMGCDCFSWSSAFIIEFILDF